MRYSSIQSAESALYKNNFMAYFDISHPSITAYFTMVAGFMRCACILRFNPLALQCVCVPFYFVIRLHFAIYNVRTLDITLKDVVTNVVPVESKDLNSVGIVLHLEGSLTMVAILKWKNNSVYTSCFEHTVSDDECPQSVFLYA